MSDPVKPALTPEEWEKWTARGGFRSLERTLDDPNELYVRDTKNGVLVLPDAHFEYGIRGRARHALAALALHGQPFGPSWEMVHVLREVSKYRMLTHRESEGLASVIAFLQALLPPRVDDVSQAEE